MAPVAPVGPVIPAGIVKANIALELVPVLTTVAALPGSVVVVDPTVIVAAAGPVARLFNSSLFILNSKVPYYL